MNMKNLRKLRETIEALPELDYQEHSRQEFAAETDFSEGFNMADFLIPETEICNTIACIAGWATILHIGHEEAQKIRLNHVKIPSGPIQYITHLANYLEIGYWEAEALSCPVNTDNRTLLETVEVLGMMEEYMKTPETVTPHNIETLWLWASNGTDWPEWIPQEKEQPEWLSH